MLLELAALKYLFSRDSSADSCSSTPFPETAWQTVIAGFFLVILLLGGIFSALSTEQNFSESVGSIVAGLRFLTVGLVEALISGFDNLSFVGKIFTVVLLCITWIIIFFVTCIVCIYASVPVNYLVRKFSEKTKSLGLVIILAVSILMMVTGYREFQKKEKEKEEIEQQQKYWRFGYQWQ